LEAERRFRFAYLRRQARDILLEIGAVGLELVGGDHGDQLIALDRVPFLDQELVDVSAYLRTDDDVVGGDDAGEHKRRTADATVGVGDGAGNGQEEDRQKAYAHVVALKHLYKTFVLIMSMPPARAAEDVRPPAL